MGEILKLQGAQGEPKTVQFKKCNSRT